MLQSKSLKIQVNLCQHRLYTTTTTYITLFFFNYVIVTILICIENSRPEIYYVSITKVLAFVVTIVSTNLTSYQLEFAILSIRERFKCLNQNLNAYFPLGIIIQYQNNNFRNLRALNKIVEMHDLLADAVLLVNSTFTIQVFVFITMIES